MTARRRETPITWEEFDRCSPRFVLGECDCGYLWLPSWRWTKLAHYGDDGKWWGRRFNPRNPLHWVRYWNTVRTRSLVMLEHP